MIYLDNAATTKMLPQAKEAWNKTEEEYFANASSLHLAGQKAKEILEEARAKIAGLLNAEPGEIYFTSGGTESDNWAICSAAEWGARQNKKHIISSAIEHHAVLHTLKKLEKRGFEITLLPVDGNGLVDPKAVEKAIRKDTCLVTIMFANNEIGTIEPVSEIGAICKSHGVVFHTDAVQAVGHVVVDVKAQNIDMLSFSSHKFGGPKGVGALFVKKGTVLFNLLEGGAQEKNKRPGTENLPGIVATATALEIATKNMENWNKKQKELCNYLFAELSKIPHSIINGDKEKRLSGNFNMCFEGIEGESLLLLLAEKGICASSGSACTSGSLDPSHVLLAIGRPHEVAHGSLRLSLSHETTKQDVVTAAKETKAVVEYLRKISPVWQELEKGEKKHVI